ncbi:DUF6484 domain-containing protein [Corallococcus macrosporus]|uniref:DUF6484 domain-containing protein n=1 Tax=Corallococcus macrosporus DSM 14697 TaxID=1189310 RepID=A0A250K5F3_9BACT|nr:DUF6484 domain-containing protein [Corallococcus macrosporus]ATB50987.1 hypothetical protein MYMAC_006644 [Corallococcus macrosporus DSM 14697]
MSRLLPLHVTSHEVALEPLWESRQGHIIGTDGEGRPVVDFDGNPVGPRVARKAVRMDAEGIKAAVESRQPVEIRFEEGDPRLPIIMALLPVAPRASRLDAIPGARIETAESPAHVIQGRDGLVLRCGDAAVTLLRNGKVSLQGTSVETSAEGAVRIKGMAVQVHTPGVPDARGGQAEAESHPAAGHRPSDDEADIQVIQGRERLVLRCGKARLTLLRSGRILLEGTCVETCAEGVVRLQGGSIQIN